MRRSTFPRWVATWVTLFFAYRLFAQEEVVLATPPLQAPAGPVDTGAGVEAVPGVVKQNANLRAGPGTGFAVVG